VPELAAKMAQFRTAINVLQEHVEVASRLRGPLARRIGRSWRYPDPPSADVDEDQEIQIGHPPERPFPLAGVRRIATWCRGAA